ncbi:MAG: hypothetical protein ABJL55_17710 [Roseibium sp.]
MLFLMPVQRHFPNDTFGKNLKSEDHFMKEHRGWGPQLTFQFFDAALDLPVNITRALKSTGDGFCTKQIERSF